MADILPPPPLNEPPKSYGWIDWYVKLRDLVNRTAAGILWSNIDFTGSNLSDIANRPHNTLQSVQGGTAGEYYHLTSAQHGEITNSILTMTSSTADLTTTDLAANKARLHKNTTSGLVKLFVNDGGVIKSVTLT